MMSKYARDFRRLLRLSIASLSIASVGGLAAQAEAQQGSLGYADAIVLPQYYPGMGRVMGLGGIESAKPATHVTVSHTQVQPRQVKVFVSPQTSGAPTTPVTVTAQLLNPTPPVVALQLPTPAPVVKPPTTPPQPPQIESNSLGQKAVVEPNQNSQLQRRTDERDTKVPPPGEGREVQPERDQPQLR